jgi:primosomal protein N' (replication factor Y)
MEARLLVAVPRPLRTLLTYTDSSSLQAPLGCRVSVPLGHGHSIGLVLAQAEAVANTPYQLKPIKALLDYEPLLDAHLLEFLQWAARYYHHAIGEVVFSAIPNALREGRALPEILTWQAIPTADAAAQLKRAKRQAELYQWLSQQTAPSSAHTIHTHYGEGWRPILAALVEKGLVQETRSPNRIYRSSLGKLTPKLVLNEQQQTCLNQCKIWMQATNLQPILLQGVTGSGKTEIYLRLIEDCLARGQQALILVPEIGLTPQLVQRFSEHFPEQQISSLHSGLTNTERLQAWIDARSGQADIVIGTRSAVFTAFAHLGLIIIDEEHDTSFKQQEGFRYHGRDLAIKRAQMLNIPILLGTATPALETLQNADQGRYHYLRLEQRPGKARPPSLEVQDIRGQTLHSGLSKFSLQAIQRSLERNEQAMLFINRRGFAPMLLCPACGWLAHCPACSANMTYHARKNRIICHHCGADERAEAACPACQHPQLMTQGQGTERIELVLQQYFPETPVVRIDRDTTSRKGSLAHHLETVRNTERLLLVGTQMLAKGHDFPNLTLVVILDVDAALLSSEYHALERFGQLLTQVAGRSGRSDKAGHVILQTTQPQHPRLLTLLQTGYLAFARQLIEERKQWQFPPFSYQALIRAEAAEMEQALQFLEQLRSTIPIQTGVGLMGPVPAPLEKRADRYRAQLLIQAETRQLRHICLNYLTSQEKNSSNQKSIRWSIDIDPVELS